MSAPLLDNRLRAVKAAVRPGCVAADVGTDHGYLICSLVGEGVCPRGYASDIRPLPLESAKRNIREVGLEGRITTLLTNGLEGLPGEEIDDVILAGMGGELIGRLLTGVDWTRDPDKRFVLQPMTRAHHLRRFLYREGFVLLDETAAVSSRFVYTIMTAAYTGLTQIIDDVFAIGGLHLEKDTLPSRRYLERERRRLHKQAAGVARSAWGDVEAARLWALAEALERKDG